MTVQEVTLALPEATYNQIQRAAEKAHRAVTDLILEAIIAAAPAMEPSGSGLRMALAQMAYLNDAALWQAACTTMVEAQRERMEELNTKQQREGLSKAEEAEVQSLLVLYRETILVRAQAAVLLKQRGYDVGDPLQFAPRV
ncbi:MAG: hypothetical protein WCG26_14260 [Chloroflexales bacterium]